MSLSGLATVIILLATATVVRGMPVLRKRQSEQTIEEGEAEKQAPVAASNKISSSDEKRSAGGTRETETKVVRLCITGFGNFPGYPTENPSTQTASALHQRVLTHLPTSTAPSLRPSSRPTAPSSPSRTRIEITFLGPLPVSYPQISSLIPPLHASDSFDALIHVGVASRAKDGLRIELRARQHGFIGKGSDGLGPPAHGVKSHAGERSRVDGVALTAWLKDEMAVEHVRTSDDAGLYLCEFIYASSLAEAEKVGRRKGEERKPVLFVHVPDLRAEGTVCEEGDPVYTAEEVTEVLERVCWFVGNGGP